MRQYRGLTKDGKWVYGWYIQIGKNRFICNEYDVPIEIFAYDKPTGERVNLLSSLCTAIHEVIPKTVGQSTGLKDKNGKEIYEGDIVKLDTPQNPYHPTRNKTIIFNLQFAQFCVEPCTSIRGWKSLEVIGNIHQNPELIEDKK